MRMPMIEKIVQRAKQMVKAIVDSQSARDGAESGLGCRVFVVATVFGGEGM
jgi:hypothetical protein